MRYTPFRRSNRGLDNDNRGLNQLGYFRTARRNAAPAVLNLRAPGSARESLETLAPVPPMASAPRIFAGMPLPATPPVDPPDDPPTEGEFDWGDGTDPAFDYDAGWSESKEATALFTGYATSVPVPNLSGCANYDANEYWPLGCAHAHPRTTANYQLAFQQCLDFGNWFRNSLGLGPVQWSNAIALAAQAHITFVCEHWDEYYADGQRGWYTGDPGGWIHCEPPAGFGSYVSTRIEYFGGDAIGGSVEGVGETTNGNHNPMNFFCAQKSDWSSITNPGHFSVFYSEGTIGITCNWVGIGYDYCHSTGKMLWCIDYSVNEPQQFAGGDIPEVLPKFACP